MVNCQALVSKYLHDVLQTSYPQDIGPELPETKARQKDKEVKSGSASTHHMFA